MRKVIIMDIDGTLIDDTKKISLKTKEVLLDLQTKGAKLVLASGRPDRGLFDFVKELEMDKNNGLIICFNGSKVIDCTSKEVLFNQTIPIDIAKSVLRHMKNFDVRPMIYKDDYIYLNDVYDNMLTVKGKLINIVKFESDIGNYKLCEIDDLEKFADYPMNKILTAAEPEYLQKYFKMMKEPFENELNCVFTAPMYFEFTAKNIDKANAINSVIIPMGYKKEDIIAFGDAENDKTMIKFAGIGVAMGNATDDIKAIADYITLSNTEDGIAYALNNLLK